MTNATYCMVGKDACPKMGRRGRENEGLFTGPLDRNGVSDALSAPGQFWEKPLSISNMIDVGVRSGFAPYGEAAPPRPISGLRARANFSRRIPALRCGRSSCEDHARRLIEAALERAEYEMKLIGDFEPRVGVGLMARADASCHLGDRSEHKDGVANSVELVSRW